jgi:hypothetical protein
MNDPNGLILEFTVDHPEVDKIAAFQRENAHAELARWLSGGSFEQQRLALGPVSRFIGQRSRQ